MTTIPEIVIYVRHSPGCKYEGDESARRCDCRKWLRWTQNGQRHRKPTGTRAWQDAEKFKRELEDQLSGRAVVTETASKFIADAIAVFLQDKQVQGVSAGVVSRYKNELGRFQAYCESKTAYTVQLITRELITGYAATWAGLYASSNTRAGVRERLRGFLRYCYECKWLDRVPQVPKVAVDEVPTLPLSDEEYERLLEAVEITRPLRYDARGVTRLLSLDTKKKLRALIQLMRWSGLAIQDAVKLPRASVLFDPQKGLYRVVTARQKTGTHVSVPLPTEVARELLAVASSNPAYFFWSGTTGRGQVIMWGSRYMRAVFEAAGLRSGHMVSHRLRDTFAVDLLRKGVPMPEVSKALGHESIKTTEKHYAKWVPDRQDRLDNFITGAWEQPPTKLRLVAGGKHGR